MGLAAVVGFVAVRRRLGKEKRKRSRVMRFRPCIDLHQGKVKQIVGGTLSDDASKAVVENFVATKPPAHFGDLYRRDQLPGGHVIMLGPGNQEAAP